MHDLREVFEMVTKQTEPDLDSWKQQQDRQRRSARNRRVGALTLVAAIGVALLAFAWLSENHTANTPLTPPSQTAPSVRDGGAFVVGLDGAVHRTPTGLPVDAFALSLSGDGTTLAFVTGVDGVNTIATIGIDGRGMRTLVPGEEPAVSPDGTQIAFVRNDDIYVIGVDGTNVRSVVTDPHRDEFPQWSPDGTTIVYDNLGTAPPSESGFSDTSVIMRVPAAGGAPTQISIRQQSSEPAYSPNGRRIVFRSHADIWVMNADGTGLKKVAVNTHGSADAPRWSPDGSRVAYTDYSPAYRASARLGANPCSCPLELVRIVDLRTGTVTKVGTLGMATFYNTPQWVSNGELLLSVAPGLDRVLRRGAIPRCGTAPATASRRSVSRLITGEA